MSNDTAFKKIETLEQLKKAVLGEGVCVKIPGTNRYLGRVRVESCLKHDRTMYMHKEDDE